MFAHYLLQIDKNHGVTNEVQPFGSAMTGITKPEILASCDLQTQIRQEMCTFNVKLTSEEHVLSVLQLQKDGQVCKNADLIVENAQGGTDYTEKKR